MNYFSFLCVIFLVVTTCHGQRYGDFCSHTGEPFQDAEECGGGSSGSNMICGTSNTCVCLDDYEFQTTKKYSISPDKFSCYTF
jgi:hypothetical protein